MLWNAKRHLPRVNLWEALHASQDLHVTSVFSFPNANNKMYFNPYIYAKAMKNP